MPASMSRTSEAERWRRCCPRIRTHRPVAAGALRERRRRAGGRHQRLVRPAVAQRDRERGDRQRGIEALVDLRGEPDAAGREMKATVIAVADELASAADLAGGKVDQRPVVVCAATRRPSEAGASVLIMEPDHDLFPRQAACMPPCPPSVQHEQQLILGRYRLVSASRPAGRPRCGGPATSSSIARWR